MSPGATPNRVFAGETIEIHVFFGTVKAALFQVTVEQRMPTLFEGKGIGFKIFRNGIEVEPFEDRLPEDFDMIFNSNKIVSRPIVLAYTLFGRRSQVVFAVPV